jgi:hypothetical protein
VQAAVMAVVMAVVVVMLQHLKVSAHQIHNKSIAQK